MSASSLRSLEDFHGTMFLGIWSNMARKGMSEDTFGCHPWEGDITGICWVGFREVAASYEAARGSTLHIEE